MSTKSKFILVQHDADKARLHYDLRFRMLNSKIWASFACRKKVPITPGQKILAVRTHDHSEKEALFVGEIKEGYGKGKLKKLDGDDCIIEKYSPAHIIVNFKGKKLKGIYHFINTGVTDRSKYKKGDFMLFKGKIQSK